MFGLVISAPSSDNPKDRNQKDEKQSKSKRKAGGQPGHKGTYRELLPVDEVDELIPVYPKTCGRCNRKLPGDKKANVVKEPYR